MTARIVVLSAPSGGGKTTIAKAVRERFPDRFGFSISATTRKPRPTERDGVDYYFQTRQQFLDGVGADIACVLVADAAVVSQRRVPRRRADR